MEELITRLSLAMIVVGLLIAVYLRKKTAEYGRYANPAGFGCTAQFAWFIQELPAFIIPFIYVWFSTSRCGAFLTVLFLTNYFERVFIYPFNIRSKTRAPFHVVLTAFFFCTFNGWLQAHWNTYYTTCNVFSIIFLPLGSAIFAYGYYMNRRSDRILLQLRPPGEESGYKIPETFLFEYISCPNYLGEIIQWIGYAIAARSLPAFAFLVFTICNLAPRARSHHAWYREKFREYPRQRTALIPFVW